MLVLLVLY